MGLVPHDIHATNRHTGGNSMYSGTHQDGF